MTESILTRLFEHNNWANDQIFQACAGLTDEQLDAEPVSATKGSIRSTLAHLVTSQQNYLMLLTPPHDDRTQPGPKPSLAELGTSLTTSGNALLTLAQDEAAITKTGRIHTYDDYLVDPWVILVQIINHATEHREQIKSMLSAQTITPPQIDGWDYGYVTKGLIPPPTKSGG